MTNNAILTFHIIPNEKRHAISFQMAYNVAMRMAGILIIILLLFCLHRRFIFDNFLGGEA